MMGQRDGIQRWGACMIAALTLSGCMSPEATGDGSSGAATRFMGGLSGLGASGNADEAARAEAAASPVISALQSRRSVLPPDSPYAQIVDPVLAANSRPAEADLRSARLRARAASKNWLPKIGPNISLTSLSDVIAQLVVEQVLFDNGRKKAERAFAKADVEVAAVTLAEDTNARIRTPEPLSHRHEGARAPGAGRADPQGHGAFRMGDVRARLGRHLGRLGPQCPASETGRDPRDPSRAI